MANGLKPVTDPAILQQLNGPRKVTDPNILAQLEGEPQGGGGFSFGSMVRNIPGSAGKYAKDMAAPITDPIGTGKSLLGIAGDVFSGRYGQELGRILTGADPSDSTSGAIHSYVKSRYETPDQFIQTLEGDPVGVLADVAGIFGGLSRVPGMSKAGRVTGAVEPTAIAGAAGTGIAKVAAKGVDPVKGYQEAAKFTTSPLKMNEAQRRKIIQTALDEGIMPTSKGVAKVRDRVEALDVMLESLIDEAGKANVTIPADAVFSGLRELRKTKGGFKIEGAKDLDFINKAVKKFRERFPDKHQVTVRELQEFKRDIYSKAYRSAARNKPNTIKEDTYRTIGRGAKEAIESRVPEAADINRRMGDFLELEPHLARSAARIENRNKVGFTTPANVGAGSFLGWLADSPVLGVLAGSTVAALNNPRVAARFAIALDRVKKGDHRWLKANQDSAEVKLALRIAGQVSDQSASE